MAPLRLLLPAPAGLLALVCVFAVQPPEVAVTTYAAASPAAAVATDAAGLALVAAGALVFLAGRAPAVGAAAMAAGLAWWAPDVVGWEAGPPLARSAAAVLAPFLLALVAHTVLAAPRGRLRSRALVVGLYAAATVTALGWALLRDPFEDPYCWSNCTDNVFLVSSQREAVGVLTALSLGAALLGGLALAVVAIRRAAWPLQIPAVLAGLTVAAYAAALLAVPAENPERAGFAALHFARAGALIGLAAGLAWMVRQARRRRAAVARLGAAAPGTLAAALARSLADPRLRIGYWLADDRGYVDAEGRPFPLPAPGGGRTVTRITRGGEPVAVVVHAAALLDGPALERQVGAAARLAVDNERLQAAILARLADLQASRARIVERGDAERRRLERDLHDGAQQRLLALSYELRIARAEAGDTELETLLDAAAGCADGALGELRELAHGIYPAILAEAGLAAAVETLADTAPLPVELGELPGERHPGPVEAAAYVTIGWAVEDAVARAATYVRLSARDGDGRLVLELHDDGRARAGTALHVADRVGALGGRIDAARGGLVVELPCA